jgi:hypothetical protein
MAIIGSFVVGNKIIVSHFPVFLASELRLIIGAVKAGCHNFFHSILYRRFFV